jgi:pimeloyl-ACP methyl ester carboxylesterase
MPYATSPIDGEQVYFEDEGGEGSPVVVLGGFLDPIDLVRRAPLVRALTESPDGFRSLFIDHRGHGQSGKPHDPSAYAMKIRVADVTAAMDEALVERAAVLGLSWGGRLGLGIAEHAPERVSSLVVVGQQPYAIDPEGPLARIVAEALIEPERPSVETLVASFERIAGPYAPDVRVRYLTCDALAMRAAFQAALAEGAVSDRLGEWRLPVLLCVGAEDSDFREQAQRAAGEIPEAELVVIDDTDHLGMDSADVDPAWPAVLRALRAPSAAD